MCMHRRSADSVLMKAEHRSSSAAAACAGAADVWDGASRRKRDKGASRASLAPQVFWVPPSRADDNTQKLRRVKLRVSCASVPDRRPLRWPHRPRRQQVDASSRLRLQECLQPAPSRPPRSCAAASCRPTLWRGQPGRGLRGCRVPRPVLAATHADARACAAYFYYKSIYFTTGGRLFLI